MIGRVCVAGVVLGLCYESVAWYQFHTAAAQVQDDLAVPSLRSRRGGCAGGTFPPAATVAARAGTRGNTHHPGRHGGVQSRKHLEERTTMRKAHGGVHRFLKIYKNLLRTYVNIGKDKLRFLLGSPTELAR
jgi:hypothetical protein